MKYLVLEIGVEKRKDTFEDKNCSTENRTMQLKNINEKIRRRRKQKKKDLPLGPCLKISTYDVDNENDLMGV